MKYKRNNKHENEQNFALRSFKCAIKIRNSIYSYFYEQNEAYIVYRVSNSLS